MAAFNAFPYPIQNGQELEAYCKKKNLKISEIVLKNEQSQKKNEDIDIELSRIWDTMLE